MTYVPTVVVFKFILLYLYLITSNFNTMSRADKAIDSFRAGNNCAQSVLLAFKDDFNFDENLASKISVGFGGGMGRLQEKCGAVTGAFMVIGLYSSKCTRII